MTANNDKAKHSLHSVLREKIVESLFVGELGREIWRKGDFDLEVLRSEFDAAGYDLVLTKGHLTRHVQLKTKLLGGRNSYFNISSKLAQKPSGCVICVNISGDLTIHGFKWFGASAGLPLHPLDEFPVARHTKGNALGEKLERPGLHRVLLSRFEDVETMVGLLKKLFGET